MYVYKMLLYMLFLIKKKSHFPILTTGPKGEPGKGMTTPGPPGPPGPRGERGLHGLQGNLMHSF